MRSDVDVVGTFTTDFEALAFPPEFPLRLRQSVAKGSPVMVSSVSSLANETGSNVNVT